MAIGVNWAEIWAPVWKAVWTQEPPEPQPEPEVTGPTPAGRPKRKRYLVSIDGQDFPVDNAAEAVQLLEKAKAVAQSTADQSVEREVKKSRRRKRAIRVYTPEITSSPEIAQTVSVYREDIEAIYKRIAVDAEIRELMRLKMLEQDEDDALFVLLH